MEKAKKKNMFSILELKAAVSAIKATSNGTPDPDAASFVAKAQQRISAMSAAATKARGVKGANLEDRIARAVAIAMAQYTSPSHK